jgi:organic hydroperoxide reductase OsmC/OhrA
LVARDGNKVDEREMRCGEVSMKINARVENGAGEHRATVQTNDKRQSVAILPKTGGPGSSVNGGELLFLALATCYCNDIYREAAKRGLRVERVEVDVEGDFGAEGEPASNVTYRARVSAPATAAEIEDLMKYVDGVAEIQNTLRAGRGITLSRAEAVAL